MIKALVLLSGGLDSMLAARVLLEQGVEVVGVSFKSCFFGTERARISAKQLGIELKEIDFSEKHWEMVKNPHYGYGKNMNPCIDCHAMMVRYTKEIMEKEGFDFIATGEVLGQRPMSQNREALIQVAKYSGAEDYLLRPLSAKLLDETFPEKNGLVVRGRLLNIQGRTRERQEELVQKYKIKEYASPGGGCLLTDPMFSERLEELLEFWPEANIDDVNLLLHGRIQWLHLNKQKVLVLIGRHNEDNEALEKLAKKGDVLVELKDEVGPLTLVRFKNYDSRFTIHDLRINIPEELKKSELHLMEEKNEEDLLRTIALLTGWYATKARGKNVNIELRIKN